MEYQGTFYLSFKEYCQINDLNEAPDEMVEKWRNDVIHNYSKIAPTEAVMKLFEIPKEYKKSIEYHEYKIKDLGCEIDQEKRAMNIFMSLKITR